MLLASLLVIIYYSVIASPRYVSQVQFVVKQSSGNESPLAGLAAIGGSSPSMRDALILQEYIQSPEMALALDSSVKLKSHYVNTQWDMVSRLGQSSTQEGYIEYFQNHIHVHYDEMSEILKVEVQGFTPEFSLAIAQSLMDISKTFINQLGEGMANQQMAFAEQEVQRAHEILKAQQLTLIAFQDKYQLLSPETQSTALLAAVHQLEADIVTQEAELKSLLAYMQPNTSEIRALNYRIKALNQQLQEERGKLVSNNPQSLNKIGANFKEIELNTQLSSDLYTSALRGLEVVRAEAFKTLKHLLIIENPRLAEEQKYPQRLYSIFTWFVVLILMYLLGRLIISIIKEHQE
ncbi:lipopolysaccharide biosynthesis protein [Shewanella sp. VB17]|nr:lipopolysaccharide biosynthesis protein [Shewanella sp. VB17]